MNEEIIVAAAEIGTSKVAVLIGSVSPSGCLSIIGHGQCSSRGVRKGEIHDFRAARDCLQSALEVAEKRAGISIENIFLTQTGSHLQGDFNEGRATVRNANGLVQEDDVERACNDAKGRIPAAERIYVVHIRNPFLVDERVVEDPVGCSGRSVRAGYWSVSGDRNRISDQIKLLNSISLDIDDLLLASAASASAILQDEEKRMGCIVLDIGGGTTDYVFYKDGYIVQAGVIPVGGDHLTNDLSIGLRINTNWAENLKKEHGCALLRREVKDQKIWAHGDQGIGDRECLLHSAHSIIEARLRELFGFVRQEWESALGEVKPGAGVFLTGGTAHLDGIEELATKVFACHVGIAPPRPNVEASIAGPEFSACIGALINASRNDEVLGASRRRIMSTKGLLNKFKGMFR